MVVYHVTSLKKLNKYLENGVIKAPVRAWESVEAAERFSKQTGRKIILRLKFPGNAPCYEGHRGEAYVIYEDYKVEGF